MKVIERLNNEYISLNNSTNFVTMVTVGHSFGGQMLFSAIRDNMLDKNASNNILAIASQDKTNRPAELRKGIGDLCILVNPAFEAKQYEPFVNDMATVESHGAYSSQQSLILATYASEGDWAVRYAFPFGRFFDALFCHPSFFAVGPSDFFGLGHYSPQLTHTFDSTNTTVLLDTNNLCGCPSAMVIPPAEIKNNLLALMAVPAPARVRPNPAIPEAHALNPNWDNGYSPFAVVQTTANVIKDHNNIFNPILEGQICKMISETYAQSYALHVMKYGILPDR